MKEMMRANVFRGVNRFGIEEVPRPHAGVGEAVIRVTLTIVLGYLFAIPLPRALGLSPRVGAAGLTISAGIAGWVEFALLRRAVNKLVGKTGIQRRRLLTLWGSAGFAAAAAWGVRLVAPTNRPLLVGGAVIAVFGAVYFASTAIAGVEEVDDILGKVRRRLRRTR